MRLLSITLLLLLLFYFNLLVHCKPTNNTLLISKYAKVAHWGASLSSATTTDIALVEGRSNSGQSLWTQRSDVKISQASHPPVVYAYPRKSNREKSDDFPAVGEVQERFQPRPYFSELHHSPSNKIQKTQNTNPVQTLPSFDSFPIFNKSPQISKTPDIVSSDEFPPNAPLPADTYNTPLPPIDTYGPPSDDSPPASLPNYSYSPPKSVDTKPKNNQAPEASLPPNKDAEIYYPPNSHQQEVILDHPPPGYEDSQNNVNDAPDDMMPPHSDMHQDMAEQDLAPPPSSNDDDKFPGYLYNDAHNFHNQDYLDHHHIYKEVTTTEAPEDERVNKGHYSYYYLGRKLWYIPLYFSVYFIVYVFVLILKSIARHKIQFKHNFHKTNGRQAKTMDDFNEQIDDIHRNVTNAMNVVKKRFVYVAM